MIAVALGALGDAVEAQQTQLLGCYDLAFGVWTPNVSLGEDSLYVAPPSRIELTDSPSVRYGKTDSTRFVILPAPGALPSIHEFAYWSPNLPDSIRMVWTNGFSGVGLQLLATATGLEGTASSSWDFPREAQTARVTARRVSCGAPVAVDPNDRSRTLRGFVLGSGDSLLLDRPLPPNIAGDRLSDRTIRLSVEPGETLASPSSIDVALDSAGIVRGVFVSYPSADDYASVVQRLTALWGAPLGVQTRTNRAGAVTNVASWHDQLTVKWVWGIQYPDGRGETKINLSSRGLRIRPPRR